MPPGEAVACASLPDLVRHPAQDAPLRLPPGPERITMRDPRGARLAQLIVQHSTALKPGDAVLIESFDLADGLVLDLVDAVHAAGALPLVSVRSNAVIRSQLSRATEAQLRLQ